MNEVLNDDECFVCQLVIDPAEAFLERDGKLYCSPECAATLKLHQPFYEEVSEARTRSFVCEIEGCSNIAVSEWFKSEPSPDGIETYYTYRCADHYPIDSEDYDERWI